MITSGLDFLWSRVVFTIVCVLVNVNFPARCIFYIQLASNHQYHIFRRLAFGNAGKWSLCYSCTVLQHIFVAFHKAFGNLPQGRLVCAFYCLIHKHLSALQRSSCRIKARRLIRLPVALLQKIQEFRSSISHKFVHTAIGHLLVAACEV